MSFSSVCPACGAVFELAEELQGAVVRCGRCQQTFTAGLPGAPAQAPVAEAFSPASYQSAPRASGDLEARAEEPVPFQRRAPKKKRGLLLGLGIGCLGIIGSCGICSGLFYFFFIHEIEEKVTDADRAIVCTAEYLQPFVPDIPLNPALGKLRKVRHFDGSHETSYEYETPDEDKHPIYLQHLVNVERSTQDARNSYMGMNVGLKLGLSWAGGDAPLQTERNDLFRWGDQSRCVLLVKDGNTVGNVFAAQKGKRIFYIILVGVYFDSADSIRDWLTPLLQKLEQYNP